MKNKKIFLILCMIHISFHASPVIESHFYAACQSITPQIKDRMLYTWHENAPIPLNDLRHLVISHYDFEGNIKQGELVIHKYTVNDLIEIFEQLFQERFPIHSMKLVDEFEGSDDASMEANNSSAFYARRVAGTSRWSNHSWGCAIDINPVQNPFSKETFFCPKNGERFLDRTLNESGMITKESLIYHLFKERGWQWGGECFFERDGTIDRHHFQKIIPGLNRNTN